MGTPFIFFAIFYKKKQFLCFPVIFPGQRYHSEWEKKPYKGERQKDRRQLKEFALTRAPNKREYLVIIRDNFC